MKRLSIIPIACISWLCPAQELWSLEDCIGYANAHNIAILQQNVSVAESEAARKQALASFFPQVSASGGRSDIWYGEDADSHAWEVALEGNWVVFDSFSRHNQLLARRLDLASARFEEDALRGEVSLRVAKGYLKLLLSQDLVDCAREEFACILKEKERLVALVDAGREPLSSLRTVESQCAGEYSDMVKAEGELKNSRMALLQLLDLPYNEAFTAFCALGDTLPSPPAYGYSEILDFAGARPEIRSLGKAEEARKRESSAAKGAAAPYIAVSGEQIWSKAYPGGQSSTVELQLVVPILDGGAAAAGIRKTALEQKRASLEKQRRLTDMASTVQAAFIEAANLYNMAAAGKAHLEAAKALLHSSEAKFRSGSITAAEFAQSRSEYLSARAEEISARWQYIFQLKIADYWRGIPITL